MFATGLRVADADILVVVAYVIWGGWLLTAAGLHACWRLWRSPAHRRSALLLAAGLLLPAVHLAAWAAIGRDSPVRDADLGLAGLAALVGLHLLTVLAAPLLALRLARQLESDATRRRLLRGARPSPRPDRRVVWAR